MTNRRKALIVAVIGFAAAIAGAFIGRALVTPDRPVENELHTLLHDELALDAGQQARLAEIEKRFSVRRRVLELELRADNARLADAIEAEHGYGPQVQATVDHSHRTMGQLQKETLEHVFAMRSILRPDQAEKFDDAVVKALTVKDR